MRIEFVIDGFVDVEVGYRVRLNGTYFVILQVSLQHLPPYHRYEIHVGSVADYRHVDCQTVAVDFDNDRRIMNWRTFDFSWFDFEGTRGSHVDAAGRIEFGEPMHEWPHACAFDFRDHAARIRAEVAAMDWPAVIGE